MQTDSLHLFRTQIDSIDQRLVELFNRRAEQTMEWLQRTGQIHVKSRSLNLVWDEAEKSIALNTGPIPDSALSGIYREIINGAIRLARQTRVGYLGPYGTFSHQAAMQYFGDSVDYENLRTLQGVFEEVSRGHVDFGLIPIENSTGGAIIESLDSFASYFGRVTIYGEIRLNIHFCLFGNCTNDQVKKIYSKSEALAQCYEWLVKTYPKAERIPYESTAAAVEFAYLADPADGIAAVGSAVAGKNFGLKPLFENIETNHDNMTRFLILSRSPPARSGADKTSLMFTCPDRPGSLVDILSVFKRNQINLSHIEKRPSREFGSDYTFFVDMLGNARDGAVAEILGEVRAFCKTLTVLGSFPVYDPKVQFRSSAKIESTSSVEQLAEQTRETDLQIIAAINERAELVVKVGEFKRQSDSPIYAPDRESAVLVKIQKLNRGPLRDRTLEGIYRELMSGSFRLEKPLRIGFVGPPGEFDHLAALRQFGSSVDFSPIRENRLVFQEVVKGGIDYGLVAVENSTSGGINETLDAFFAFHQDLSIYGEVKLEIHYGLLADCRPEQVNRIYAKPSIFESCRNWLSTQYPQVTRINCETTEAAIEALLKDLDSDPNAGSAAIGCTLAGEQHGVQVLFEGIEDRQSNITRYLILSRSQAKISGNDKTSIMFTTSDRPGALVDVLDVFKRNAINLTHLEKRPSGKEHWDYTFFLDFEGHRSDPRVSEIIGEARAFSKELTVLGSFPVCQRIL